MRITSLMETISDMGITQKEFAPEVSDWSDEDLAYIWKKVQPVFRHVCYLLGTSRKGDVKYDQAMKVLNVISDEIEKRRRK